MKNLFVFATLALALIVPTAAYGQMPPIGPPPTCDPSDPSCTLDNGCNHGHCNPVPPQFKFIIRNLASHR